MKKKAVPRIEPCDPAIGERPRIEIRRPAKGETLVLWPIEPRVTFYWVHYDGRRTRPCLQDRCFCHRADISIDRRREGWILAREDQGRLVKLCAITYGAWQVCPQLRDPRVDLRECLLTLVRGVERTNSPVVATVKLNHHPIRYVEGVPYTHLDLLLRVWYPKGCSYEDFNAALEALPDLGTPDPAREVLHDPNGKDGE